MNDVHIKYAPPRLPALALGLLVFLAYRAMWLPLLAALPQFGDPVPTGFAVGFSLIIGYGLTMLGWLIWRTKGQVWDTFRPTRGRILGALALGAVTPIAVFSWLPWIIGSFVLMGLFHEPLAALAVWLVPSLIAYPLAAMIVRHTYQRRWLRFGLFCLTFWTAYAFHMLWHGVVQFTL